MRQMRLPRICSSWCHSATDHHAATTTVWLPLGLGLLLRHSSELG